MSFSVFSTRDEFGAPRFMVVHQDTGDAVTDYIHDTREGALAEIRELLDGLDLTGAGERGAGVPSLTDDEVAAMREP